MSLDAASAYAFLSVSQVCRTGSELHSEEQHEKGVLVMSWIGAELPSSTR